MRKIDRLIARCSAVEPLDGRVLIAVNKLRTHKDIGHVSKPADPNIKEEDIIPGETEMALEVKEVDVNNRFQSGIVLQIPKDETRFDIGDTILFEVGASIEFDWLKGVSVLRKYDVVGVVSK